MDNSKTIILTTIIKTNMIKKTVNQSEFIYAMTRTYDNTGFTYEGKVALYDYLEQLSYDIELDPIALYCEYTEYSNIKEAYENYNPKSPDVSESTMRGYLEDRTQLIEFDGGIIIQDF